MGVNYRAEAVKAARQYHIPVQPFLAQLQQESGFQPGGITSGVGAKWIGQFIPSTARAYGVHDDLSSIYGAAHYMADNLHRYGTLPRALSAYNSGRPDAYLDPHFANGQTYNYVRAILGAHPAAAGGAPAAAPLPAVTAPTAPAAADTGIPLAVQQILNANNRTAGIAPVDYGKPIAAIGPARIPVVKDTRGPVSPNAPRIIALAEKWLGTSYSWGGGSPTGPTKGIGRGANTVGFDCSGFLQYLNAQVGVKIPRSTYDQFRSGHPVKRGQLMPGDAVFYHMGPSGPEHVKIYIGHGQTIAAPHTGDVVKVERLEPGAVGYRRYS